MFSLNETSACTDIPENTTWQIGDPTAIPNKDEKTVGVNLWYEDLVDQTINQVYKKRKFPRYYRFQHPRLILT